MSAYHPPSSISLAIFVTTPSILTDSRQILQVIAPGWRSSKALLQCFERTEETPAWQAVDAPIPVSLGRAGLRWGIGRHPAPGTCRSPKREGDGCSPAGVFAISALFGCLGPDSERPPAKRLPYLLATESLKAIDDPASRHYNRIVDTATGIDIDWQSCEDMLRQDRRYTVGAVIDHNPSPSVAGAGSCIFLHVWEERGAPTAGCTAGAFDDIARICRWLDASAQPLLVQLPRIAYNRLRSPWQLP